jgi:hypothetical protein
MMDGFDVSELWGVEVRVKRKTPRDTCRNVDWADAGSLTSHGRQGHNALSADRQGERGALFETHSLGKSLDTQMWRIDDPWWRE